MNLCHTVYPAFQESTTTLREQTNVSNALKTSLQSLQTKTNVQIVLRDVRPKLALRHVLVAWQENTRRLLALVLDVQQVGIQKTTTFLTANNAE
jgi:hypothetical protein